MRLFSVILLATTLLTGCASQLPFFSESYRQQVGERDIQALDFRVPATIEFRSVRVLDTAKTRNVFSGTGHRILKITDATPGRLIGKGDGWMSVDFGNEIILTFSRRARDGVYAMPGWGTLTIRGDRYDIAVGIMSGNDLELHVGR
jgi:hypothetical protein